MLKETERLQDHITKRHQKLDKLSEQALKTSIKNQVLGKDADKNEYWFFKEDPGKLFVKKYYLPEPPKAFDDDEDQMICENHPKEFKFSWHYYDEEDEFTKLMEGCNTKGMRERKLQESLRRIAERMRMRKGKKKREDNGEGDQEEGKEAKEEKEKGEEEEAAAESKEEEKKEEENEEGEKDSKDKKEESMDIDEDNSAEKDENLPHFLFVNDNWDNAFQNAVWFGKKIPPKRQYGVMVRRNNYATTTSGQPPSISEEKPSLDFLKAKVLAIEELYMEIGLSMNREWAPKNERDRARDGVLNAGNARELAVVLLEIEKGFSDPVALKIKDVGEGDGRRDEKGSQDEGEDEELE